MHVCTGLSIAVGHVGGTFVGPEDLHFTTGVYTLQIILHTLNVYIVVICCVRILLCINILLAHTYHIHGCLRYYTCDTHIHIQYIYHTIFMIHVPPLYNDRCLSPSKP